MKSKWIIPLFLVCVIIVPICVASVVKSFESDYAGLPDLGSIEVDNTYMTLKDHSSQSFTIDQLKDKITVAHCFFSHCAVVCPKMLHELESVSQTEGVNILSFTVDPANDTIEHLARYASSLGLPPQWRLLTGSKQELYRFLRKSLQLVATDGDGGEQDFIHSENLVLIDGNRVIRGYYKGTDHAEITKLIADIKKLRQ